MTTGRRIVLGVSGGVAAYKSAFLARLLIESGATVRVVMTEAAQQFVGKATFRAITGQEPVAGLFNQTEPSPHTTLGQWADAIIVAPATASTISKLAYGESSNALIATVLASKAPVLVAPAMHTEMWEQASTQANIATLRSFGYAVVGPESGPLAGGDVGIGRMSEPQTIVAAVNSLSPSSASAAPDMSDLSVLVTAGGTREPIDPVRYIGNRSSGKMGNALALAASQRGAKVVLVTTQDPPVGANIEVIRVDTADEMAEAVWHRTSHVDVAVMAAAVADFKPADVHSDKLRRADGAPDISLVSTPDVLAGVHDSQPRPLLVGFAAEVGSLDGAREKAQSKGVDLLVANDIQKTGSGFGSDTNEVRFVYADGTTSDLDLMTKSALADHIWDAVLTLRSNS